jgi:hypothetical protein
MPNNVVVQFFRIQPCQWLPNMKDFINDIEISDGRIRQLI